MRESLSRSEDIMFDSRLTLMTMILSFLCTGFVSILANPDNIGSISDYNDKLYYYTFCCLVDGYITAESKKIHVKVNESTTLSCHVQGYRLSNFTWERGLFEDFEDLTKLAAATHLDETHVTMTLHFSNVTHEDEGYYRCWARDSAGPIYDFMYLTVAGLPGVNIDFVKPVGVDSVYLGWTVNDGNDPVEKYSFQYIRKGTQQLQYYFAESISTIYNDQVFTGLENGTSYKFGIVATNSIGDSNVAYSEWVTTLEKDPSFIPNFTLEPTGLDSITISGVELPAELRDYVHYYVAIASHGDEITGPVLWVDFEHSYRFRNLTPATHYAFGVAACNVYITKCGNWSNEKEISTFDKDLSFIPNVSVTATTLDSIRIQWSAPPPELLNYTGHYKVMATHTDDTRGPVHVVKSANSYVFENLTHARIYQLRVAACLTYKVQCDPWSAEQVALTMDRDPKFIPSIWVKATTRDSIWIGWSVPPAELQDRVHQYKVMATYQDKMIESAYLTKTTHFHIFENLESDTTYELRVAACSEYTTQCGNWSTEQEASTTDKKEPGLHAIWPSSITAVIFLLIVLSVWMFIQKRNEKARRREFIEATLDRFNKGMLTGLNPGINVSDQAELLPYEKGWEYPRELLKFDKILGSGAFGIVRKAEAKSISRTADTITTVAVKMVRSTASLNHMTALTRELKILVHLGKHLNIVNLLGACTKRISYGELLVIVEFCRFGNLRDYLLRRRANFVTTEDCTADSGFSCTERETANDDGMNTVNSGESSTEADTDCIDTSVEVEVSVPVEDSFQPGQPYQGDYTDENLKPICKQDLLCWAWQVSCGMKYLGTRRVLHGDLAARNILLADNNVVKICDFGLAKALYEDENYKKRGHDPLPVKWMAIEAIRDRVFSVQSDIWSFGIVLWEFFTLAETPYPGIGNGNIYRKLADGFRMARPKHATADIYKMMLSCWNADPSERPSFEILSNSIADLLTEGTKMFYVELAAPYAQINADALESGARDYLTMTTSEDTINRTEFI